MSAWGAVLLAALGVAGCLGGSAVECTDGSLCPPGSRCLPGGGCAANDQVEACAGLPDGDVCSFPGGAGQCQDGVCLSDICGDGIRAGSELCDDGNRIPGDGCSSTCDSTEVCGNGVTDFSTGEGCDCGDDPLNLPPGCDQPNSMAPGALCRPGCIAAGCGDGLIELPEECEPTVALDGITCESLAYYGGDLSCRTTCRYDISECAGRCGDGLVNGPETCDGQTDDECADLGFVLGRPDCNGACDLNTRSCGNLNWSVRTNTWNLAFVGSQFRGPGGELLFVGATPPNQDIARGPNGQTWGLYTTTNAGDLTRIVSLPDFTTAADGTGPDAYVAASTGVVNRGSEDLLTPIRTVAGETYGDVLVDGDDVHVVVAAPSRQWLRYRDGTWTTVLADGGQPHAVTRCGSDLYAVGASAGGQARIWRLVDETVTGQTFAAIGGPFTAAACVADRDLIAAGNGRNFVRRRDNVYQAGQLPEAIGPIAQLIPFGDGEVVARLNDPTGFVVFDEITWSDVRADGHAAFDLAWRDADGYTYTGSASGAIHRADLLWQTTEFWATTAFTVRAGVVWTLSYQHIFRNGVIIAPQANAYGILPTATGLAYFDDNDGTHACSATACTLIRPRNVSRSESIHLLADDTLLLVATDSSTTTTEVLRWDGAAWSLLLTEPRLIYHVGGYSTSDLYLNDGGERMLRFDGTAVSLELEFERGSCNYISVFPDGLFIDCIEGLFRRRGTTWEPFLEGRLGAFLSTNGTSIDQAYGSFGTTLLDATGVTRIDTSAAPIDLSNLRFRTDGDRLWWGGGPGAAPLSFLRRRGQDPGS